jgi:hypothetical protein
MGFLDDVKGKAQGLKDKATGKLKEHEEQIEEGLDKAAGFVDAKTGGKYSEKITSATDKTKDAIGKLADEGDQPPTDEHPHSEDAKPDDPAQ